MNVSIGGLTLALVLQQVTTEDEIEGFLLGAKNIINSKSFNDSSNALIEKETIQIVINNTLIVGDLCSFYESDGSLNSTWQRFPKENIIGWFKYQKNRKSLRPSLRELSVHHNMRRSLKIAPRQFLFAIFTSSQQNNTTITTDYRFMNISETGTLIPVELNINNLVVSSQMEYRDFIPQSPASFFPKVTSNEISPEIRDLELICKHHLAQLKNLAEQVHSSETEIKLLEEEIKSHY